MQRLVIPAIPVMLVLGVALMAVAANRLRDKAQLVNAWLAGWYAVAVLGATMLPLHIGWGPGSPDWYRIVLVPILEMRPGDFLLNTAMMLPLAWFLRTVLGVTRELRVVRTGFLISLTIELTQLVLLITLHGTRWFDVNDLISNTLGAWLGFVALERLLRFPVVRNLARRTEIVRPQPAITRS
ncbi:VanZ family protein [Actinoplanes sp. NPDC049596]|uniref:VanZ family protein n=1 Tax=unclassified Actinoplanes TaxID=2626549 RepID=UPI003430B66A